MENGSNSTFADDTKNRAAEQVVIGKIVVWWE